MRKTIGVSVIIVCAVSSSKCRYIALLLLVMCFALSMAGCRHSEEHPASLPSPLTPDITRHLGIGVPPRLSPDGQYLAVSVYYPRENRPHSLMLINLDAMTVRQIASGQVCSWSPDSGRLAYMRMSPRVRLRGVDRPSRLEAYIYHLSNGTSELLAWVPHTTTDIIWAPSGDKLCLKQMVAKGSQLTVASLSEDGQRQLVHWRYIASDSICWDAQSRYVYFIGRSDQTSSNSIARVDVNTAQVKVLATASPGKHLGYPRLSSDGIRLFYFASTTVANLRARDTQLWMLDTDTLDNSQVSVPDVQPAPAPYAVSSNGSKLIIQDAQNCLWLVDISQDTAAMIADNGSEPRWLPNSSNDFIYFARTAVRSGERFELYRQSITTGQKTQIAAF